MWIRTDCPTGTDLRSTLKVTSFGDHRIAMSCAILGLFSPGETVIEDTAWGAYRTEFYPAYDYKAQADRQRQEMLAKPKQ